MIRTLLIALALALSACSTTPATTPAPVSATGKSGLVGFATISLWGTWESELAPAYTRLAVLRHNAARALDANRIPRSVAVQIQALADSARARIDTSRRGNAEQPTAAQRADLAEAKRLIESAEQLLESKQ